MLVAVVVARAIYGVFVKVVAKSGKPAILGVRRLARSALVDDPRAEVFRLAVDAIAQA